MAEITLIAGSVGLVVAGFAAWYTIWHRRISSFQRLPVRARRLVHVLREGAEPGRAQHGSAMTGGVGSCRVVHGLCAAALSETGFLSRTYS